MTVVLDGTYQEARRFARSLGWEGRGDGGRWLYARSREVLMGLLRDTTEYTIAPGTFSGRLDAKQILEECEYRRFFQVHPLIGVEK